ncbi:unnamed protein product [Orchesella dallaii]|uniref:Uncharacterized protein n=1 Tax=Orchesella dallaii TaxID=48710 RepID=A0ABP1QFH7_9HEXA
MQAYETTLPRLAFSFLPFYTHLCTFGFSSRSSYAPHYTHTSLVSCCSDELKIHCTMDKQLVVHSTQYISSSCDTLVQQQILCLYFLSVPLCSFDENYQEKSHQFSFHIRGCTREAGKCLDCFTTFVWLDECSTYGYT